jgi:hypothetical protein
MKSGTSVIIAPTAIFLSNKMKSASRIRWYSGFQSKTDVERLMDLG